MLNVFEEVGKMFGQKEQNQKENNNGESKKTDVKPDWKGVNQELIKEMESIITNELKAIKNLQSKSTIVNELEAINDLQGISIFGNEFGTIDDESAKIKQKMDGLNFLLDRYHKMIELEIEKNDRHEKIRVDEKKIDENKEIELEKNKLTPWKMLMDIAGIAGPILAYNIFQTRLLKFEETGKLLTAAGKMLKLPKFW